MYDNLDPTSLKKIDQIYQFRMELSLSEEEMTFVKILAKLILSRNFNPNKEAKEKIDEIYKKLLHVKGII